MTDDVFPRLSQVRAVRDDGTYLGPFGSAHAAELAAAALHEAVPLRQCTARLSPKRPIAACILADLGKCPSPCDGRASRDEYALLVEAARTAITTDPAVVVTAAEQRISKLSQSQRYEEAAVHRDRMVAFLRAAARGQRLRRLSLIPQLVAAAPR
nr:endonuclease [Micromonospora sp. DSM 115978]